MIFQKWCRSYRKACAARSTVNTWKIFLPTMCPMRRTLCCGPCPCFSKIWRSGMFIVPAHWQIPLRLQILGISKCARNIKITSNALVPFSPCQKGRISKEPFVLIKTLWCLPSAAALQILLCSGGCSAGLLKTGLWCKLKRMEYMANERV